MHAIQKVVIASAGTVALALSAGAAPAFAYTRTGGVLGVACSVYGAGTAASYMAVSWSTAGEKPTWYKLYDSSGTVQTGLLRITGSGGTASAFLLSSNSGVTIGSGWKVQLKARSGGDSLVTTCT